MKLIQLFEVIQLRGFGGSSAHGVDAFLSDYEKQTKPHPLNPKMRFYGDTAIELSPWQDGIHINDINTVGQRRSGSGTRAIEFLKFLADKYDVELDGIAFDYEKSTDAAHGRLADWYSKRGFDVQPSMDSGHKIKYMPQMPGMHESVNMDPQLMHQAAIKYARWDKQAWDEYQAEIDEYQASLGESVQRGARFARKIEMRESALNSAIEAAIPDATSLLMAELNSNLDNSTRGIFHLYAYHEPFLNGERPDDYEQKFAEWMPVWAKARVENAAVEIADNLRIDRDGIEVHRHIMADESFPANIDKRGLGEYWSWDMTAAEAHWAGKGDIQYEMEGRVDPWGVNWEQTLFQNAHAAYEDEKEIFIPRGTPVKLVALFADGEELDPSVYGGQRVLNASVGITEAVSGQYVYHATLARNLGKIMQKGLTLFNTSNWVKAGDRQRYQDEPSVFAFAHPWDAYRWAHKIEWEYKEPAVIIKLKRGDTWVRDPSEDFSIQGGTGEPLMSTDPIPAGDIVTARSKEQLGTPASTGLSLDEFTQHVADEMEAAS